MSAGWRLPKPGCCSANSASWYLLLLPRHQTLQQTHHACTSHACMLKSALGDPRLWSLQALVALNAPKLDALWLEKMRSAKLDQLRAHIALLMEDHERGLASRDSAIQVPLCMKYIHSRIYILYIIKSILSCLSQAALTLL